MNGKNICSDIMERFTDPELIGEVITRDETWIFQFNSETKRQTIHALKEVYHD